jgi:predicted NAD-dependent protein-ADP-ribosyltransferase YbiA (DUF1768 family)
MARWRPRAQQQQFYNNNDIEDLNSEYYGRRTGLLMDSGAGRWFQADSAGLVGLAQSTLSDDDMLETLLIADGQVRLNELRSRFESLPPQMQKPEFEMLPTTTRKLLTAAGYSPEEEQQKGLLHRITSWDIPLLPEEWLVDKGVIGSSALGAGLGVVAMPFRGVGFFLGKGASGAWEGLMKFNRFARHTGRSYAYIEEGDDNTAFLSAKRWYQAWNRTQIEEDSFTDKSIRQSIELIGSQNTEALRQYMSDPKGLYEYFLNQGESAGQSEEQVRQKYYEFEQRLTRPDFRAAMETLDGARLDGFNYSIRLYNRHNFGLPEVDRDSWAGKTVGMTGSLAQEILLDPLTWVGGFYTKVINRARAGLRGGSNRQALDMFKAVTLIEREAKGRAAFAQGMSQHADQVAAWLNERRGINLKNLGLLNMNLRAQGRAQNRMIDRINRAFREINEIQDEVAALRIELGDAAPRKWELEALAMKNLGMDRSPLTALSRDFPSLDPIIEDMRRWHARQRGTVIIKTRAKRDPVRITEDIPAGQGIPKEKLVDADRVEFKHLWDDDLVSGDVFIGPDGIDFVYHKGMDNPFRAKDTDNMVMADLSTFDGYWNFLGSTSGQLGLATRAGGVNPEAMWLPRISAFGAGWVKGKKYMREVLDFALPQHALEADLAQMFSTFLTKQTSYVIDRVADDISEGVIKLSEGAQVDKQTIQKIYNEPNPQNKLALGKQAGLGTADVMLIEKHLTDVLPDAKRLILEDGDLSTMLNWYQDAGFKFDEAARAEGKLQIRRQAMAVPFSGAGRAARNYYRNQMHPIGSMNAEISRLHHVKAITESMAVAAAYYPAKWAEKLTTFTPRTKYMDITDKDTAIREFKALVDMGSLAHMPRTQIDRYLSVFIAGDEAQRWVVQTQFLMDFLGRSGALIHGGEQMQEYVSRFIRHAGAHYSMTNADSVGLYGVTMKRAIMGSAHHESQLSALNVIPDYAQLAVLSKHLSFYRKIGWGTPLSWIDKQFARYWRPAVLLRLGYVARNGGEELFSWWLREGPKHYFHQKLAKAASDTKVVYDEYGRKIVKDIHKLVDDPKLNEQLHQSIIWKPMVGVQRAMNEVLGVGDMAITTKALKQAVEQNKMRWSFMSADEQEELFMAARNEILIATQRRPLGIVGRGLMELGQLASQKTAHFFQKQAAWTRRHGGGIPTRQQMAERVLGYKRGKFVIDPDHELRIELAGMMMTKPTILDQQMKTILGAYDVYTNFDKNGLQSLMKSQGVGNTVPDLMKLPMDYTASEMSFIENIGDENNMDKAIAIAQMLGHIKDSEPLKAYARVLQHHVPAVVERSAMVTAERLLDLLNDYEKREFVGYAGRPAHTLPGSPGEPVTFGPTGVTELPITTAYLSEEAEPVIVVVSGLRSRGLDRHTQIQLQTRIRSSLESLPDGSTVRVGGADGVDRWAEDIAEELVAAGKDLTIERYYVPGEGKESWRATRGAGHIRNRRMLEGRMADPGTGAEVARNPKADALWAFHMGEGARVQPSEATMAIGGLTGRGLKRLTEGGGTRIAVPLTDIAKRLNLVEGEGVARLPVRGETIALRVNVGKQTDYVADPTSPAGATTVAGMDEGLDPFIGPGYVTRQTAGFSEGNVVVVEVKSVQVISPGDELFDAIDPADFVFSDKGSDILIALEQRTIGSGQQGYTNIGNLGPGRQFEWRTSDPHSRKNVPVNKIPREDADAVVLIHVEEVAPDVKSAVSTDPAMGRGTAGAMREAMHRDIKIDNQATFGNPGIIPEGVKQRGHYERARNELVDAGHDVKEGVEGDQTVLRAYKKGTARGEQYVAAEPAVEPKSATQTVLMLLDKQAPRAKARLREGFLHGDAAWNDAVDDVLDMVPAHTRHIWEDLLRPPESGRPTPSATTGVDPFATPPAGAAPAAVTPKKHLAMKYKYGEEGALPAAAGITSTNTFDAINAGERTATTRTIRSGQLEDVEVGDIIGFTSGDATKPVPIHVRVTEKRLAGDVTPEEWARVEGYDAAAAAENWTEGKKFSEQRQITYELVEDAPAAAGAAPPVVKIISGGQSGVDTAGLRVGQELGLETGGTMPAGFRRFDDTGTRETNDPDFGAKFGMVEHESRGWAGRTGSNATEGDGTIWIGHTDKTPHPDKAGFIATRREVKKAGKPFIVNPSKEELLQWMTDNNVRVLNVAGPRTPQAGDEAAEFLRDALSPPAAADVAPTGAVVTNAAGQTIVHGQSNQNVILSNWAEAPFTYKGVEFLTAEGAYHAHKTGRFVAGFEEVSGKRALEKAREQGLVIPREMKEIDANVDIMREILEAKWEQVPRFRNALAESGEIVHPVGDSFWREKFPELLTELRDRKGVPTPTDAVPPTGAVPPAGAIPPADIPRTDIDRQVAAMLSNGVDPAYLTDDFGLIVERARQALISEQATPEQQSMAHSMARAHIGTDRLAPELTHPIPDDMLRYYVPMIPIELAEDVTEVIMPITNKYADQATEFRDFFLRSLQDKLDRLGVTGPAAEHARLLLNPAATIPNVGGTATSYMQLAAHWASAQVSHFPLVTGSTDGRVAHAIGEALIETVARQRGVSRESLGLSRLRTRDVSGDEFFNSRGGVANMDETTRGNIAGPSNNGVLTDDRDTFGAIYYGYGPQGLAPAAAFGEGGLKNNTVFGIGAHTLAYPADWKEVPMASGKPVQKRLSIYKHRAGERPNAVVREGTEIETSWYNDDEWELVTEQFATGDDLFDFIEEMGHINGTEMLHWLTNVSRGGEPEAFGPWLMEILRDDKISLENVINHTGGANWWSKAPKQMTGYSSAVAEPSGAWMNLVRNWFDGIVNPMIGGMVREPLFLHYLVKAWKQTKDIRQMHWHKPAAVERIKHLGRLDEDGQFVIDELKTFLSHDWPMAGLDPDTPISRFAFAVDNQDPYRAKETIKDLLAMKNDPELGTIALSKPQREFYSALAKLDDKGFEAFFKWAKGRRAADDLHLDAALKRAMTLTSAFIDDHRIRSQFQTMVRTAVPFWFAEDQFLRRLGRGMAHNPLMMRRLNLTMNSAEHMGFVQEDANGTQWLLIPGNEMLTNHMVEIANDFPIVGKFLGGPLGGLSRALMAPKAMNIHVIPGYDLETMGQMGLGPILSVPINAIGNRDASIRPMFEKNMVGGRWTPDSTLHQFWTSAVPSIIVKPTVAMFAQLGMEPDRVIKAQSDVIKSMALRGDLPTEEEIAQQANPELFMEELMEQIAQEARHYLWFQTFTWWLGPGTGKDTNLIQSKGWEWNEEFYELLSSGISWEEAYRTWVDKIKAEEGVFDPYQYSPFMVAKTDKVPFAVMESTQIANKWIVGNEPFLSTYKYAGAFFMPRTFGEDVVDEYSAEAHSRQLALGLRHGVAPRGILENIYADAAQHKYFKVRSKYLTDLFTAKANNQPTELIEKQWDMDQEMFLVSNPIFMKQFQSGEARERRARTLEELKVLVANPELVPDGPYKAEILLMATMMTGFVEGIRRLEGATGRSAQQQRDQLRIGAFETLTDYVYGRPYLNELYYSVFLPTLGDTWIAKFNAGLIEV